MNPGTWVWSEDHQQLCKVVENQTLWGNTFHRVWLPALDATQSLIAEEIVVVTVADREADIYELFVLPRRPNSEFLIRAQHNRITKGSTDQPELERLQQRLGQTPPCGQRRGRGAALLGVGEKTPSINGGA